MDFAALRTACARKGYAFWPAKAYDLFLFGVRTAEKTNLFDDQVGCAYVDGTGREVVEVWPATTDPGLPIGVREATMVPGQHRRIWTRGVHHPNTPGAYFCLVPVVGAVIPVYRGPTDRTTVYRDSVGVQMHHAGAASTKVDGWSEGCQVLQRTPDLDRVLWLYDQQVAHGHGTTVSYTLFLTSEIA